MNGSRHQLHVRKPSTGERKTKSRSFLSVVVQQKLYFYPLKQHTGLEKRDKISSPTSLQMEKKITVLKIKKILHQCLKNETINLYAENSSKFKS